MRKKNFNWVLNSDVLQPQKILKYIDTGSFKHVRLVFIRDPA